MFVKLNNKSHEEGVNFVVDTFLVLILEWTNKKTFNIPNKKMVTF